MQAQRWQRRALGLIADRVDQFGRSGRSDGHARGQTSGVDLGLEARGAGEHHTGGDGQLPPVLGRRWRRGGGLRGGGR
ncbi:hypothetical protein B7486_76310, partial [cyanobacterium TDX16]